MVNTTTLGLACTVAVAITVCSVPVGPLGTTGVTDGVVRVSWPEKSVGLAKVMVEVADEPEPTSPKLTVMGLADT